jgi:hypothetical protein
MLTGHALTWPLLVGVLVMLAGSAYLWATHEADHAVPFPRSRLSP